MKDVTGWAKRRRIYEQETDDFLYKNYNEHSKLYKEFQDVCGEHYFKGIAYVDFFWKRLKLLPDIRKHRIHNTWLRHYTYRWLEEIEQKKWKRFLKTVKIQVWWDCSTYPKLELKKYIYYE